MTPLVLSRDFSGARIPLRFSLTLRALQSSVFHGRPTADSNSLTPPRTSWLLTCSLFMHREHIRIVILGRSKNAGIDEMVLPQDFANLFTPAGPLPF